MVMDPKLLNILACPDCQADLIYRKVEETEELVCSKCSRVFEIKDGVPLLLPKE